MSCFHDNVVAEWDYEGPDLDGLGFDPIDAAFPSETKLGARTAPRPSRARAPHTTMWVSPLTAIK